MSVQGPILLIASKSVDGLAKALTEAGAFPVVEVSWAGAETAAAEIKPAAIVAGSPGIPPDHEAAMALARKTAAAVPFIPMLIRGSDDAAVSLPEVLWIAHNAPAARVAARLSSALRLRTLHATVIGRAEALKAERNIIAELPSGDPLDDATVLLVGRGRYHPILSVAVGEVAGVMGALSADAAARCLNAREVDGIIIGDGLAAGSVEAFLTLLAEDYRFRDLPIGLLATFADANGLPNLVTAADPMALLARTFPLIRMRALESALKRLLQSIEHKGMVDARTGLFNPQAFAGALDLAIGDCAGRGTPLSLARFSFEQPVNRRVGMDAARLVGRLMRDTDFACREDDGSILFVFGDTALRDAHVAARRLASVLKHTMLRMDPERPNVSPEVALAALKPADTAAALLQRVAPQPVAAA